MPFVNRGSKSEVLEKFDRYEHQPESAFGEVFGSSVGLVLDEELSISSMLNRQGWDERRAMVEDKIETGEIQNPDRYRTVGGRSRRLDYSRIAEDLEDPAIKTDAQLREERNELLASRRKYAEDVIERGSGMAQFLGALNGYVLDPINLATVGIGSGVTAARGVSAIGRAALTARNTALVEGAAELGIQTLVFQHKQDIESPYSAGDALANIGLAATGAAALGGITGGLSGWLEKVLKVADELPQTDEIATAKEYLRRTQANLKQAPKVDAPEDAPSPSSRDTITGMADEPTSPLHLDPGDVLVYRGGDSELDVNRGSVNGISVSTSKETANLFDEGVLSVAAIPGDAKILKDAQIPRSLMSTYLSAAKELDNLKVVASNAKFKSLRDTVFSAQKRIVDHAREQGFDAVEFKFEDEIRVIRPGVLKEIPRNKVVESLDVQKAQIDSDVEFLREMNTRAELYDKPAKTVETYQNITDIEVAKKPVASASQREREVLNRQGIAEDYDKAIAEFQELDNPILRIDDEDLDPRALIDQYDEEISGLDDVLRCVYG